MSSCSYNLLVSPGTGFVRNVPGNLVRAPATVISAGTSGIQTVANDGVNMITSLPANAIQFVGTGFRYKHLLNYSWLYFTSQVLV